MYHIWEQFVKLNKTQTETQTQVKTHLLRKEYWGNVSVRYETFMAKCAKKDPSHTMTTTRR